ncbi:MAG: two-component regulator propeller domain-containing protein [Bacteroidota bacterium]|nr:two-component regulator propeller domain-containing protein [Bacteroidota bacterium]
MRRFLFILFLIPICFSCGKQQKPEKQIEEISFAPPVVISASHPTITLLDSCPKPIIIVKSTIGSSDYTIPTSNGPQVVTFSSPKIIPLISGEAGGFTFMQNYNTEQGLALSIVSCGYSDKKGNLWFGTYGGGVSRYDGKSFTNFTAAQGLAGNLIKTITEDKSGNLWFGTNGSGVSKYDGRSFTNYTTAQGLVGNIVKSITEDNEGNLWFCTEDGVSKYGPSLKSSNSGNFFSNFTTDNGLLSNYVSSSFKDRLGDLWFGTNAGVNKYDPSASHRTGSELFTSFTTSQGLVNNDVTAIIDDNNGNIWFGTRGGVSKYNPNIKSDEKSFTNYTTAQGLTHNNVQSLNKDKEGNIWFATGAGVSRYDFISKTFINFTTDQGLSNNVVHSITEDKMGNIWFGSAGDGLNKYDGKSCTSFTSNQGLSLGKVWHINEDETGDIWVGTSAGVCKYDGRSFWNISNAMMANVRSIINDKNGNIWFGCGYGAIKYDRDSFTMFTAAQGLVNKGVLSMIEDKMGNIWFGTYGNGVYKYDGKSFTNYTTAQGLANNIVKCIIEDKSGNIWFGSNGNGLSKYDPSAKLRTGSETFTNYSTAQGLANNTVLSCIQDKSGNLWFGTDGGVSKYDPLAKDSIGSKPFTTYTSADGLANDVIYAIVEDTLNNVIWFGTNLGLSGLKLNSLSSGSGEPKFEIFNNNNGYPIKDINTSALFIDSKGVIWTGTGNQLVRFDYKAIHRSIQPPKVFIQALKIHGEKISWYNLKSDELAGIDTKEQGDKNDSLAILNEEVINFGHHLTYVQRDAMRNKFSEIKFDGITRFYYLPLNLELPFKHNNVTFDFAAIETGRPQLVRYQYFLEGYDSDWNPATDKTFATFGNIYEGSYTFKLKAQSPDGIWSEPVTYTFRVLPPWYRTWWMYSSYLFIVLSSIGLFFRWRTASLIKEKEILELTVKERTAEVVEQKELVEKKNEFIEEKQKEIVDSINYAKRIQYTLLANDALLQQNLKEYFVLFQPKDIVSGDFYWATLNKGTGDRGQGTGELHSSNTGPSSLDTDRPSSRFYLAICDSTGHGVPGAFMSLLNTSFLNEAITEKNIKQPNEILNYVRQRLIESISQDGAQDGMDGILLCFENGKITYAAANNAPVIVRDNAVIDLPADKMPIGKGEKDNSFTLHTIDVKKGDLLYFYTDGYADQFGGPKGKKFKYKQLENLLVSIHQLPVEEQKQMLSSTIENWKGDLEQVDDILIIGMRV